jgi:hypothetical protein
VPGLLIIVIGLLLGLDVVFTFDRVHVLLVGELIVCMALVLVGTLSMFIALVLNALQDVRALIRETLLGDQSRRS